MFAESFLMLDFQEVLEFFPEGFCLITDATVIDFERASTFWNWPGWWRGSILRLGGLIQMTSGRGVAGYLLADVVTESEEPSDS